MYFLIFSYLCGRTSIFQSRLFGQGIFLLQWCSLPSSQSSQRAQISMCEAMSVERFPIIDLFDILFQRTREQKTYERNFLVCFFRLSFWKYYIYTHDQTLPLGRIGKPESMDHPKDQPLCLVDWTSRVHILYKYICIYIYIHIFTYIYDIVYCWDLGCQWQN